jgi:hypothetical protein
MGCGASSPELQAQQQASKEIDKQLKTDNQKK